MRPSHRQRRVLVCIATISLGSSAAVWAQTPDNAALLYYQAFLLYEEPKGAEIETLDNLRNGKITSNDVVTQYMEKNRHAINAAVAAASIAKCDWGYDYSQGVELAMPSLARFRSLARLLAAEARWQADQGNYETALARCVAMRKMAVRACDRTLISYLVGIAIDGLANRATVDILSMTPPDVDALGQLKSDLASIASRFPSSATSLAQDAQVCAINMTRDKLPLVIDQARDMADEEVVELLKHGDDAFFQRNREYYLSMIDKMTFILKANMPYDRTCAAFDDLAKQLSEQMKGNPDATLTSLALDPAAIKRIYQLAVRRQTHLNAILTATDLYIVWARTGQLPANLPSDSPPDLFSGKPFTYTKTAQGFVLHSENPENKWKDFEFKIAK